MESLGSQGHWLTRSSLQKSNAQSYPRCCSEIAACFSQAVPGILLARTGSVSVRGGWTPGVGGRGDPRAAGAAGGRGREAAERPLIGPLLLAP